MKINEQLKKYRIENNLTQQNLADKLNVSRQTISKWETGRGLPDIENLIWLSDIYQVSLDELVGRAFIKMNVDELKKSNRRKEMIRMLPKRIAIGVIAALLLLVGLGGLSMLKERHDYEQAGLIKVYGVKIDKEGYISAEEKLGQFIIGDYDVDDDHEGEYIEATKENIKKYDLENPRNRVFKSIPDEYRNLYKETIPLSSLK